MPGWTLSCCHRNTTDNLSWIYLNLVEWLSQNTESNFTTEYFLNLPSLWWHTYLVSHIRLWIPTFLSFCHSSQQKPMKLSPKEPWQPVLRFVAIGYHQLCHEPGIPHSVVEDESLPWSCVFCTEEVDNPHVHNPFILGQVSTVRAGVIPPTAPKPTNRYTTQTIFIFLCSTWL